MVRLRVNRAEKKARKKAKPRKMKRRGGGKAKGSAFERAFCKELSLWWSAGEGDDHFWRSSMSGGRATVRNRRTANCYGDIAAMTPLGAVFTSIVTVELKTGYPGASILDLVLNEEDKGVYKLWIKQARTSCIGADTPFWLLVHKLHARNPIAICPLDLWELVLGAKWEPGRNGFLYDDGVEKIVILKWNWFFFTEPGLVQRRFSQYLLRKGSHGRSKKPKLRVAQHRLRRRAAQD